MGILNVSGPKGNSQANSQGRWSRVERKPTTNPSDANMCDLSRERPTFEELEPQTKKHRLSSTHGPNPSTSPSVLAVVQPSQSP